MDFNFETLTEAQLKECNEVATQRVRVQVADAKKGMRNASYSYGGYDTVESRSFEKRMDDAIIGARAELIGSLCAKCVWPKVMNQYKGNTDPDLKPTFRGNVVNCDARGSRKYSTFIYRPRDVKTPDGLLIAVTNLPEGPECQVGHAFFKDVAKWAAEYPEYLGSYPGATYYELPFKFLSGDFSEFGSKQP